MKVYRRTIAGFPFSVRMANLLLWTSWASHCLFVYVLFSGQASPFPVKILVQQMVIGIILCVFFFLVKRWARIFSILFNAVAVGLYLLLAILFYTSRPSITVFSILNMALFAASVYYFLAADTTRFFKPQPHPDARQDSAGQAPTLG